MKHSATMALLGVTLTLTLIAAPQMAPAASLIDGEGLCGCLRPCWPFPFPTLAR